MKQSPTARRTLQTALVIHDAFLLAAIFYSPIIWGAFNTGGQAFAAALVAVAALSALIARRAQGRPPAVIPNAIHLPALIFIASAAVSSAFSVSHHASALEFSRTATGVLLFLLVANRAVLPAPSARSVAILFACFIPVILFIRLPGENDFSLAALLDPSQYAESFFGIGRGVRLLALVSSGLVAGVVFADRQKPRPIMWYAAALIVPAAFTVAAFGLREKFIASRLLQNESWQIFSTFFNPNPLGGFLAMAFFLAMAAVLAARGFWWRLLWGVSAFLSLVTVAPTYSKGAFVSLAAATAVFVVLAAGASVNRRRNLRIVAAIAVLVALGTGLALASSPSLRERVSGPLGPRSVSNMFRILAWKGTARMALANPVFGVGTGAFQYTFMKYAVGGYTTAAHENYLQIAAEQGFPGLLAFLWIIGATIWTARRALVRAGDFRARIPIVGAIAGMTVVLVHSFLDYDLSIGAVGLAFWLLIGIVAHYAHGRETAPLAVVQDAPQQKRKRRPAAWAPPAPPAVETGVHIIPWPAAPVGRAGVFAAALVALSLTALIPIRNALAASAMRFGDGARGAAMQAHEQHDGEAMRTYFDIALDDYRRATELDPGWATAWERYGVILSAMSRSQEADAAMQRAIELEPTSYQPRLSLARHYYEQGLFDRAVEAYRQVLARYPNNTSALRWLGASYQQLGQTENALNVYRRMVEVEGSPYNKYRALGDIDVDTEYAFAHYQLGRAYYADYRATGRRDALASAGHEFKDAIDVVAAYQGRGKQMDEMFRLVGQPRGDRGGELQMLEGRARWRLAAVYDAMGDKAAAAADRDQALRLLPDVAQAVAREDGGRPLG